MMNVCDFIYIEREHYGIEDGEGQDGEQSAQNATGRTGERPSTRTAQSDSDILPVEGKSAFLDPGRLLRGG